MRVRVVRSLTCSCAEEDHHNGEEVALHGATRSKTMGGTKERSWSFRACLVFAPPSFTVNNNNNNNYTRDTPLCSEIP